MLPRISVSGQSVTWQKLLAQAINSPSELLEMLNLPADALPLGKLAGRQFALRVPRGYVARMRKGDPHDPLLRQVFPSHDEEILLPGYSADPVGDLAAMPVPGVLHKYHGRALLVTTGACAIHCRYCFRRHFPYSDANPASHDWDAAVNYIASDSTINEVILSGGDPLTLSDQRLAPLAQRLSDIPHLRRLRIHTRLPIVLPERVDEALLDWLHRSRLKAVMVIHANHANEIDEDVVAALSRLKKAGVELLNQTVLLRGVNDSAGSLAQLSEALFDAGVFPYYLHLLDPVQGAAHFDIPEDEAVAIVAALRCQLPGFLVPQLVREIEGEAHKIPIN